MGWLLAERVLRAGISALALAVVARHLAPAGFGALNLALTLVGLAMPLAQLGFDVVVVRELVRTPQRAGELLGTATILRFVAGAFCTAVLLLLGFTVPALAASREALGPVAFMLIVQAVEVPDLWFRAQVQSWPTAIARTVAIAISAVGKCILALRGADVAAFAWITLAELAVFQVGLWLLYRRTPRPRWRWDRGCARALLVEGGHFALAAALGGLAFRVDQLAAAWFLGETPAGQYFAALRLMEIPTFVAASVATALLPALARDENAITDGRFERAAGLLAALGWITALGTSLAGPWLMHAFFGAAYDDASTALLLRGWAMLPFFTTMIRAHLIVAARAPGAQMRLVVSALVLHLALSLFLIPRFGLTGAAVAFLLTELLTAWVLPLFVRVLRPTLRPQLRAWLLPWQPKAWPSLIAVLRAPAARPHPDIS